ncbi:MAG: acyl transferase [Cyclobacteriaceae bacterium]|nr:acyl transferase [Cyclobacteriaceae bacterium]UYN88152.1 MAG: acyl transferase [Cyclobacteriaceae bacterium]
MENIKSLNLNLYTVNATNFDVIALQFFHYQAENNPVYRNYLHHLKVDHAKIESINSIPFLPISFFKSNTIKTGNWESQTLFESSATTGQVTSKHEVKNLSFYLHHAARCFEFFFGSLTGYHFFALLPSYLERNNSSLVAMMDYFIKQSGSPFSGFYLSDLDKLKADIEKAKKDESKKIVVWGVSFALLDLAESGPPDLSMCLVFETGGMKGRRREVTRLELHTMLKQAFKVSAIYSEYGMTELFSQAYTRGGSTFFTPPWMKVMVREVGDPFTWVKDGKPGGLNIVDLANVDTLSFIETEDAGQLISNGFEVQGRLDNTDIRGCNLMVE